MYTWRFSSAVFIRYVCKVYTCIEVCACLISGFGVTIQNTEYIHITDRHTQTHTHTHIHTHTQTHTHIHTQTDTHTQMSRGMITTLAQMLAANGRAQVWLGPVPPPTHAKILRELAAHNISRAAERVVMLPGYVSGRE